MCGGVRLGAAPHLVPPASHPGSHPRHLGAAKDKVTGLQVGTIDGFSVTVGASNVPGAPINFVYK